MPSCRKGDYFMATAKLNGQTEENITALLRMERMAENGEIGTIIVKDLSRFGREQVEMGRLTQVVYPSLGIRFIAIQERVDTLTGDGVEMMPFHNIFNEWYAAQTVRKIFALCLAGKGPMQIARQLEEEQILSPAAYFESIGRKHAQKVPKNPCGWEQATVGYILENRQYTGCAVNFKSTTVSYKVHKRIQHSEEDYQIIPDMQEAIIPEEQWLRVQELRKHKRRPTKTGRTSLFSGLLYCYDCKSKMHFVAAKSMKRKQEHFRCSQYKSGRGECSMHYIRDIVLERLVLEAVSDLSDFVRCYEPVFLYLLAKKNNAMRQKEYQQLQQAVEDGTKRIAEIDRLIEKVFEQNAGGILSDERFAKMLQNYEKEQKALTQEVEENRQTLQNAEQRVMDLRLVLRTLREMTDIKELTPTLVNSLIERIEVHNSDKSGGHSHVKVDIYFTAVGMIDIPTEKEILTTMEEIRNNPQDFKFVA